MYYNYLPILKQFVGQYKNVEWCDILVFTKQQEQYVLTGVKEIKYFLVKMLVSNV